VYDRENPDSIGSYTEEYAVGEPLHERSAEIPMNDGEPEGIF
jgi:hypothetical protein